MTGSLVLAVLAGAVIPMAVYAYLMTPRSVGLMHALPVTRTSQFFTHFLSGFGLLTAGNLLIFLLSALAMMPSGSVDWAALGLWLLVTELLELFFLSLGALCAMATGWLLAIPVLYGAANCIVLLVCVVVQFLQRWFYFGFESTTFPMAVIWLTPIARLSTAVCGYADVLVPREGEEVYLRVLPEGGMTSLLVYTIVGLALLALGWLLYRRRPSEAAGDAIAFRWLPAHRPVDRGSLRRSGPGPVPQRSAAGRSGRRPGAAPAVPGGHGPVVLLRRSNAAAKVVPRLPPQLEGGAGAGDRTGRHHPVHPAGLFRRPEPHTRRFPGGHRVGPALRR